MASIGQVWTRHLAPAAPAVMAFIATSVLRLCNWPFDCPCGSQFSSHPP